MKCKQDKSDMASLRQRIASDNARTMSVIDQLMEHVDNVLDAAKNEAWDDIERMTEEIVDESESVGCHDLADCANHLQASTSTRTDSVEMKRDVIRLVGAMGRAKVSKKL